MGKLSKAKGANGEYQVRDLLQPVVDLVYQACGRPPPMLERNLEQTRHGGSDFVGLPWLAIEVKWRKQRSIGAWWQQVKDAAGPERIPILIYRGNNEPWRVVMFGHLTSGVRRVRAPVDIAMDAFLVWLRIDLENRLAPMAPHVHGDTK